MIGLNGAHVLLMLVTIAMCILAPAHMRGDL